MFVNVHSTLANTVGHIAGALFREARSSLANLLTAWL